MPVVSGPPAPGKAFNPAMVVELLRRLAAAGIALIKAEQLDLFDGQPGFSLGQGQKPERIPQGYPPARFAQVPLISSHQAVNSSRGGWTGQSR